MDSSSNHAPLPPRKRKAQELDHEDGTLSVAPPKNLHASITWDVQAKHMAHHMFCTKFVAFMDTAIESQKWTVDIQKKCMELMDMLRLSDATFNDIHRHKLAANFREDPSFIRIMMLKTLYPLEKMKRCNFLLSAVESEYPGWDYSTESYPPSKYPTSQPAERELESVRASIEGMDKLLKDIHSTAEDTKNKLQDVAATEHSNFTEANIKKWMNDVMNEVKLLTKLSPEDKILDLLNNIRSQCDTMAKGLLNLESQVQTLSKEMKKGAKDS
ncbi:unnamed protein product [Clonostachys byssicola]|uniref:Uncharacterized protein n=1 Tax=Clonostachys byssicola TaxID=160290 RepID=A0A9N9UV44_9HYPO|nr:unnamed protein product [Clonostachys byssicola]